jgi:hypothetical protein
MLHANGHEHRDFDSVVEVLSQKYHTIAVDWPGFGASPAPQPPRTASASGLADMLEAICRCQGVGASCVPWPFGRRVRGGAPGDHTPAVGSWPDTDSTGRIYRPHLVYASILPNQGQRSRHAGR